MSSGVSKDFPALTNKNASRMAFRSGGLKTPKPTSSGLFDTARPSPVIARIKIACEFGVRDDHNSDRRIVALGTVEDIQGPAPWSVTQKMSATVPKIRNKKPMLYGLKPLEFIGHSGWSVRPYQRAPCRPHTFQPDRTVSFPCYLRKNFLRLHVV